MVRSAYMLNPSVVHRGFSLYRRTSDHIGETSRVLGGFMGV
jgi:hypothetical protein